MYCSSCGMAVAPSLSYAIRCGAELNPKDRRPQRRSEGPELWCGPSCQSLSRRDWGGHRLDGGDEVEVVHFNIGLIVAFSLWFSWPFLGVTA